MQIEARPNTIFPSITPYTKSNADTNAVHVQLVHISTMYNNKMQQEHNNKEKRTTKSSLVNNNNGCA